MSCCRDDTDSSETTGITPIPVVETPKYYQYQVGVTFTLTFTDGSGEAVDLTNAQAVTLLLERPDRSILEIDLTPATDVDERDGILTYQTLEDDLDQVGRWRMQGLATVAGSPAIEYRTEPMSGFQVYANLT